MPSSSPPLCTATDTEIQTTHTHILRACLYVCLRSYHPRCVHPHLTVPVGKSPSRSQVSVLPSPYCTVALFLSVLLQFEQLQLHSSKSHFSLFNFVVEEIDKE